MELIECFLQFTVQKALEEAEVLFHKSSPPEKPFEFKYSSRDILLNLSKDPFFSSEPLNEDLKALSAYINYLLGVNFLETEETSQGEEYFKNALSGFSQLSEEKMSAFLNILQDIYNNLGFLLINREELEKGMGCLAKAEDLYLSLKDVEEFNCQDLKSYLQNRLKNNKTRFNPYWKMGISQAKTESFFTLTLFYLAQAYTKLGMKEKAAFYCGNTMKRQYENKEFQLKEWCINSISLAEFYQNNKNFAQAFYLLQAGDSLIPAGKRKKLKATFNMSFARLFQEFLKYMVTIISEEQKDFEGISNIVNKKHLIFETFPTKFVDLEVPKDPEGVTKIFRLSNTQYKKSLAFFVLDGYVTEHIEMSQEVSEMLKTLALLETDNPRKFALLEKRKDLLEPLQNQLNPKAYPAFCQKLLVELAEIYNEMFENRFHELFLKNDAKPKKNKVDAMNKYGFAAIGEYQKIEKMLLEQQKEQKDQPKEHYQSIINTRFNMAKAFNKIYAADKKEKVEMMKKSLDNYKFIVEFIKEALKTKGNLEWDFSEQLKICTEMVELIPAKIDKINKE